MTFVNLCMYCGEPRCECFRVVVDCEHCGTMTDNRYNEPVYGCLMHMLSEEGTCRLTTTSATARGTQSTPA